MGDEQSIDRLAARRGLDGHVYEPAEDSALLASAVLDEVFPDETVVDVGTGSGYVARRLRDDVGCRVLGIDINPHACQRAAATIAVIRGDLLTAIANCRVDAVVCNPPYLPTAPDHERDDWLSIAVSGGETGRTVVDRLIPQASRALGADGRLYLLVSSLMDVDRVRALAREHGFVGTEIGRDDSFPYEVLSIIRFERNTNSA